MWYQRDTPKTIEGHFSHYRLQQNVLSHRFTHSYSKTSCYSDISYNYLQYIFAKERTFWFMRDTWVIQWMSPLLKFLKYYIHSFCWLYEVLVPSTRETGTFRDYISALVNGPVLTEQPTQYHMLMQALSPTDSMCQPIAVRLYYSRILLLIWLTLIPRTVPLEKPGVNGIVSDTIHNVIH